jgi:CSLREA domain-containing protein
MAWHRPLGLLALCACGRLGFDARELDGPTLRYPAAGASAVIHRTALSLVPTTSRGLRFAVAPPLPAGLKLDPATGAITGTPDEAVDEVDYTVTGAGAAGTAAATLQLTVLPGSVVDATADAADDDGGADAVCFATAAGGCTLRAALQTANRRAAPQLILLGAASYPLDAALEPVANSVEIAGQGAALTTVRAAKVHPGFGMLTLTTDRTLRMKRATFRDFGPAEGGVIEAAVGALVVDEAAFTNNTSDGSGGVAFVHDGAGARLRRSTFVANHAGNWGGVIDGEGDGTRIVVEQCTAMQNTALWGSFAHITTGTTLLLQSSTLYGNTATRAGTLATPGGVYTLINDTIAHNTNTFADSAGIYLFNAPGSFTIANTIVAFNTDATGAENNCNRRDLATSLTSRGGNIVSDGAGNCAAYFAGPGDHLAMDPGLAADGPTSNGGPTATILLTEASRAIDAAEPAQCPAEDQRGMPRPDPRGLCDVGAVEMP